MKCDNGPETMPPYLYRRDDDKSSRIYVRLTAPKALHKYLASRERQFRQSTGTSDLVRARVIGAEMVARKRREWDELLATLKDDHLATPKTLSDLLIQQVCGARLMSWVETDNLERLGDEGLNEEQLERIESFCKLSDTRMRSVLAQGRASREWGDVVDEVLEWCEVLGYGVSQSDPLFVKLVRAFAVAERKGQQFIAARNEGQDPTIDVTIPAAGVRLSEIAPRYEEAKRRSVDKKTVSKNMSIWARLVDFLADKTLDEVTSADIYSFLEDRLYTKNEPWSQGYVDGHGKRALKEIFAFARTLGMMNAPNPVSGLEATPKLSKDEAERRKKPRLPFTSAQINQILRSDFYVAETDVFKGKLRQDFGGRYWPLLIALLHGCRVREYMQLVASDVVLEGQLPCFRFRIELDDERDDDTQQTMSSDASGQGRAVPVLPKRKLKSSSVVRTIPIHPKLIELGLLEYVAERREKDGINAPLFVSALPEPGGKSQLWGRAFEQTFGRYKTSVLKFPNGYNTHSFRHAFEDRIRDAQARNGAWPPGLAQFLSGRKIPRESDLGLSRSEGSAKAYGDGYRAEHVVPYFAQLDFSDIVFPEPYERLTSSR